MRSRVYRLWTLVAAVALVLSVTVATAAEPATVSKKGQIPESPNGVYLVQMLDDPVVAYEGGISGLDATAPAPGQKINPNSPDVVNYVTYLVGKHDEALAKVGGGKKVYDYAYSFSGFAASLSLDQAHKMASVDGVVAVSPDELQQMDTDNSPDFLGLTAPGGPWAQLGGVGSAGEGIVIGIVDSGIWPESLSFTDRTGENGNATKDGKLDYQQIPGWHGRCVPGKEFVAADCNQKLIGAQYFNAAWGGNAAMEVLRPWEYLSPRDYNGHGTHTASTAGGNNGVPATGAAAALGTISGMAPRARIAAYKALWSTEDGSQASGFRSDLVAAIDQAVADGVDVINYSISGTRTSFLEPVQVAFLFAADAGVFVSASAGNSGPSSSTVAHPSPWVTTVAAGTHARYGAGSVTLGNGATYEGASMAAEAVSAPLIYGYDAGLPDANPDQAARCFLNTLDPALVAGKIVVCDRGTIARVDKSLAVWQAGGVGMIHANVTPSSINADLHFVPTVHVDHIDGAAIRAYAQTAGATATINQATILYDGEAPFVASFSSRGPLLAGGGDLLKPDVTAPGVDILAAVAPPGNYGRDFDLYSGTSMSAPHVAGLAALLKQAHPDWSPMMIKSALMTTASQMTNQGNRIPGTAFDYGAGHVQPNDALDPGLVYDSGFIDWLGFLCGTDQLTASYCPALSIDPSDLNGPSIAIADLPGTQTVTRKVTNVGSGTAAYAASVSGMAGVTVAVAPSTLVLNPGETGTFEVTFSRTTAPLYEYTSGQLAWSDGVHDVRIPMVVRLAPLGAPTEVTGAGTDGSLQFGISFGYEGDYSAGTQGLAAADMQTDTVMDDPDDLINRALATGIGVTLHTFDVPAGAAYARFSLFDDYTDGADDLDLYVFGPTGGFVGASGFDASEEEVDVVSPMAGTYRIIVHGRETDGRDANYTLFNWAFGPDAGNMTVTAPAAATVNAAESVTVDWTGLEAGTRYLGAVSHYDASGQLGMTLIRIDTD